MNPHKFCFAAFTKLLAVALLTLGFGSTLANASDERPVFKRGDVPPAELGLSRDGEMLTTTQFAGKVLVVTFWATWCPPCRAELSMLAKLKSVAGDSLNVVAVNIESRETFRAATYALRSYTLTFANDPIKRYSGTYGVNGIPHMLIIGKDGKVIAVHRGYGESSLDGILKEINAAMGPAIQAEKS